MSLKLGDEITATLLADRVHISLTHEKVWYFEEGCVALWRGLCGTLKRVVWHLEDDCVALENGGVILWTTCYLTNEKAYDWFAYNNLKFQVSCFQFCFWHYQIDIFEYMLSATTAMKCADGSFLKVFKRVVWYFEEGGVVLWRGCYGTLKRVMWYFEEGGMVFWRGWCGTLKRVLFQKVCFQKNMLHPDWFCFVKTCFVNTPIIIFISCLFLKFLNWHEFLF